MTFIRDVDRGLLGKNEGLPNGLGSLNNYIYGIQKARYYLLGGETGTGKTTLTDKAFLFEPYHYMKAINGLGDSLIEINWTYYSFEQGKRSKRSSWASKLMHDKFKIRLPVAYLLGKGKNRINDEHYQHCLVIDGELEELFDTITMIDIPVTPSQFKLDLYRYGTKHGTWHTKRLLDANGKPRLNKAGKEMLEVVGWTPKNPDATHMFLMDHIAYAALEFPNLKQNIDTISRTAVQFREMCQWTFVFIQQFNTELASVERQKFKKNALAPQRVDFGDSRYTYQDADVVFGMLNPNNYDLLEFGGYNIVKMGGYAIWAFLMKNRHDGPPNRAVPFFMDPVAGTFDEIPEAIDPNILEISGMDDPLLAFYTRASEFNESNKLYETS